MSSRRFVFDTNIIISGFLFEKGKSGHVIDIAEGQGHLILSAETSSELSEVLERDKFDKYVSKEVRRELFIGLLEEAELIEVSERIQTCRDPDDDKFLELAVEAEQNVL